MKLISLTSNQDSFRPVNFNPNGISLIVAKHNKPTNSSNKNTYNGLGKSLIIHIIHFCLGGKTKNFESFVNKLPGWQFILKFEINNKIFITSRTTENANKILLNDSQEEKELTIDKFNKEIEKLLFNIPAETKFLTFRSLFPFFIRPKKESYVSYDRPVNFGSPYAKQLCNAFLLGLDIELMQEKYKLRKEQERIEILTKNIQNDDLLKDFFSKDKDVSLRLKDLEDEIAKLYEDINQYEVADDYYDVKNEADEIEKKLANKHNEIVLLNNQIENIEKSLKISPDLEKENIEKIYNEAKIYFSDILEKKLEDLEKFYTKLTENRLARLATQKQTILKKLEENKKELESLKKDFDKKMKYLGAHQALDVVLSVKDRLSELEREKEKLENYDKLIENYHNKMLEIRQEFIKSTQKAEEYKKDIDSYFKQKQDFFRKLAKRFYPKSAAGITFDVNDGENQVRFDIHAKIESDGSDGINNVKIFCYDTTLLFKGENHNLNFIFHDSRLYDGVDERQKSEMFKIIYELFHNKEYQYIASINQNQLDEIKKLISDDEFDEIFTQNTILELTDEFDSEKLLGLKVDINYD